MLVPGCTMSEAETEAQRVVLIESLLLDERGIPLALPLDAYNAASELWSNETLCARSSSAIRESLSAFATSFVR